MGMRLYPTGMGMRLYPTGMGMRLYPTGMGMRLYPTGMCMSPGTSCCSESKHAHAQLSPTNIPSFYP